MKRFCFSVALLLCLPAVSDSYADPHIQPGDRIAIIGNTFADQLRIHGYLETLLLQHSRDNPVSIRNLGWGGDMLAARDRPTGFPSEESTLKAHRTDVIIACFGMGESFAGEKGIENFKAQLEALITSHAGKTYNGKSAVRLILVSPIACEDLAKLTPRRDKRNRDLSAYTNAMREIATNASVPFVDLFETSRYLMDEPTGPKLTTNGIHLNPYGYWAISQTFFDQLVAGEISAGNESWMVRIDASTKSSDARGVKVSDIDTHSGLSFLVTETSPPQLSPPTDQPLPPQLQYVRDTLAVSKLKPGDYRLTIDGKPIVVASAAAWADGVPIDATPTHQSAESFRAAVNDKNLQFTYSWKALNQVHIVGERKSSPSGRQLPEEIIDFNELANQREAKLKRGVELKSRRWKLSRISE